MEKLSMRIGSVVSALTGVLLAVGVSACGDSITGPVAPEDVTFNPALGIDLAEFSRLPSGVYIRTVVEGSGDASEQGNQVTVNYELRLPDNTLVDASPPSISWVLGGGGVILGFDLGVTGMRVGEQRRIIIPSSLGYGPGGSQGGAVPGNSVLIFDITMLALG
jgi:hypothetical protein